VPAICGNSPRSDVNRDLDGTRLQLAEHGEEVELGRVGVRAELGAGYHALGGVHTPLDAIEFALAGLELLRLIRAHHRLALDDDAGTVLPERGL